MNAITLILELPGGALTEPVGGCLVSSASVVQGEGYPGCFQFLTNMNKDTMNIIEQLSL